MDNESSHMKAIRIHGYGAPDVLVLDEVPDPVPGAMEVVVTVEAAGVNPADYKYRNGMLAAVNTKPLPFIPGMDIVGRVSAVGEGVDEFAVGDRVLAMLYLMGNGGYAEQVAVPAAWCARLPAGLDAATAATLPTPATTAVEWIEDDLAVGPGHRVLITGAAGAVGRIACYVAKQHGAYVAAAVKGSQAAAVVHADDTLILDDGSEARQNWYDSIADTIGGAAAGGLLTALKPGGVLSTVATDPVKTRAGLDVTVRFFGNRPDAKRLGKIAQAVSDGALTIAKPRVLPLSQAAQAHRLVEAGGAGKFVLKPDAKPFN